MTWEIVAGIFALVGFGISVMTPIIKLNSSITKLNCSIDNLNDAMSRSDRKIDILSAKVENHEIRISVIEKEEK